MDYIKHTYMDKMDAAALTAESWEAEDPGSGIVGGVVIEGEGGNVGAGRGGAFVFPDSGRKEFCVGLWDPHKLSSFGIGVRNTHGSLCPPCAGSEASGGEIEGGGLSRHCLTASTLRS